MTGFLLLAFIFLIAGVVAVPLATRLGLGSVLGYLIAGIAISPVMKLLGVDLAEIQHFAEFGVVMMLFLVGLELEPKLLWSMRARLIGLGGGQLGLTALAVMGVGMAFGQPWSVSLAVGLVFALSSTAIVLQTLAEKGLSKGDAGQSSFAVLLFQDIAVIPMLALLPLLALPGLIHPATDTADHAASFSLVEGLPGWQAALVTLAAVAFVVFVGNSLTGPLFRFITKARLRELFTATALMIVIGIALLMSLVGLSPALGTFLAGVVLANSTYRHELESDIEPFKGLLLGVFFMTVGASINFELLSASLGLTLALTLGLMLLKTGVMLVLARVFGLKGADKWLFAMGLAQAGEFGFVLLTFTVSIAVIPADLADLLRLVVALSMLLTPGLFILYDRLIAPRFVEPERASDNITESNHILIAGIGRVGGQINRMLKGAGYTATVIDFSSKQIDMLERFGVRAYYGDATRPDLLASAGIAEARLLIIAIDDKAQITELARYALQTYPNLHVVARAVDRNHVYDLWAIGCRDIIRETYDSSLRMGRSAYEALGASRDQADHMVSAYAAMDRKSMIEAAEHYDPAIPIGENERYINAIRAMNVIWEKELTTQIAAILRGEYPA